MRKGQEIELTIDDMRYCGEGIGYFEDKPIYVKGVVPQEKLKLRITKKKKEFAEARVLEMLEEAPYCIEAACPHFSNCGGCTFQMVPYEKQLELKKNQVLKLFLENDIDGFIFDGIKGSPSAFEYRNKMEYTFGDERKDGELCLGMHVKHRSFSVFTSEHCNIVDEDFRKILKATIDYFKDKNIPHYKVMSHEGVLRNLVIRKAFNSGEILVNLVTTSKLEISLEEYKDMLLSLNFKGTLAGILHTVNDGLADMVQCDSMETLYGKDYIMEELLGLKFKITPFSFFQTNTKGAEVLYSTVKEYLGDSHDKTVFDLYCGTGTIGQITKGNAKKVIGIEIVEEAVKAATENAKLNNLTDCTFIAGDVFEKVKSLTDKPDIIILDPPRPGVMEKALKNIVEFNAPSIIYVSCNPKTLVTDLKYLESCNYKAERVTVVDMFPHTGHVETVCLIQRK